MKQPGREPGRLQAATIRDINRAGGLAFWADSLETVQRKLAEEGLVDE